MEARRAPLCADLFVLTEHLSVSALSLSLSRWAQKEYRERRSPAARVCVRSRSLSIERRANCLATMSEGRGRAQLQIQISLLFAPPTARVCQVNFLCERRAWNIKKWRLACARKFMYATRERKSAKSTLIPDMKYARWLNLAALEQNCTQSGWKSKRKLHQRSFKEQLIFYDGHDFRPQSNTFPSLAIRESCALWIHFLCAAYKCINCCAIFMGLRKLVSCPSYLQLKLCQQRAKNIKTVWLQIEVEVSINSDQSI